MKTVCKAVAAGGAAVYRKWQADSEIFRIVCMGHWSAGTPGRPADLSFLGHTDLPPSCWEKLAAREIACLDESPRRPLQAGSAPVMLPLFLGEDLSGFICVAGMERQRGNSSQRGFLESLIPVFELWLSREDAARRWDDLVQFLPNPTFVESVDGKITAWNPAVEELTGWKADRVIGKGNYTHALPFYSERRPTCSDLILHPDPEWESRYLDLRREGDHFVMLAYCPSLPGGGAFLTGKTGRLYDITGRLRGSIHTVRDVTRERQIEKSLHQSEAIYRAITNFAGFGILFFTEGSVQYYNEYVSELLGISEGEVSLTDITGWIHPEDRDEVLEHFRQLFRIHGRPARFEFRAQHGETLRHYAGYAQVLDYEGKPTICFVLNDTTEQKELAGKARLNEMKLYHEGRLTSLGIMAAGIAHELNQPLNTIRVITDGLLYGREKGWGVDPDELYENMEMISRQVLRMSGVIQNIRNFAREDRDYAKADVNVNQAILNVFSMIGRQFEAHDIKVTKNLQHDLPAVQVNLNRLEQVIMNLLVNARQALDECGRDHKELRIRTGRQGGAVFVEVTDNATGIPPEAMERIFDPFFTTKEVGQGTGLGLTISQSIIREFKGTIDFSNNPVGGATFLITVPAQGEGA